MYIRTVDLANIYILNNIRKPNVKTIQNFKLTEIFTQNFFLFSRFEIKFRKFRLNRVKISDSVTRKKRSEWSNKV